MVTCHRAWCRVLALVGLLAVVSCAGSSRSSSPIRFSAGQGLVQVPPEQVVEADLSGLRTGALAPAEIRIHNLTTFARLSGGQSRLVVHLELRDRFGHAVKGLGDLRLELSRPAVDERAGGPGEERSAVWYLDITDPERNAASYDDLVMRLYTIPLDDLPAWVESWRRGDVRGAYLRLDATFRTLDEQGRVRTLRDRYRLVR